MRLRPLGAGCGSSSSSTAATSNAPIKVGVIVPENTQIYNAPDIVAAMRAAAYAENKVGGLDGRKIVVDFLQRGGQSQPGHGLRCQLVSDGSRT